MKFEVIAFWSDKDKEGMVCVKKNGSIIDSELTSKTNESEFLVWRKVKSLAFLHKYNLMGVNPALVK